MSSTILIIQTIIMSCQAQMTTTTSYEYALARQKNCQRDTIRCVMDYAKDHNKPSELSEYDLILCMSEMTPESNWLKQKRDQDPVPNPIVPTKTPTPTPEKKKENASPNNNRRTR